MLEAHFTGNKGVYECPMELTFFGPSDPVQRARIEDSLKKDKLIKATQLKQTKKQAETRRAILGLKGSFDAGGLETDDNEEAAMSLENILKSSEAVEFRKGGDAIKTLAMGEEELSKMPLAAQPPQLKSTLLPYQLQVWRLWTYGFGFQLMSTGFGLVDREGKPIASRDWVRKNGPALETPPRWHVLERGHRLLYQRNTHARVGRNFGR